MKRIFMLILCLLLCACAAAESYTVSLTEGRAIHCGPGHDFEIAQTLDEDGVFTIVEEVWDEHGNLWGRLKSGAGWVFLQADGAPLYSPIFADYADENLLRNSVHHRLIADNSEYAVHMAFFANEALCDIAFSALELTDSGMEPTATLFTLHELTPGIPMVVSAAFPGDLSAYRLTFTDASGIPHCCTVSISGMDGSLELIEEN